MSIMSITDASNHLSLYFIFNILFIEIIFVANGVEVSNSSITNRVTINTQIKNESFTALATDVEVVDLTKTINHLKTTSPMTPIPLATSTENKIVDAKIDFINDDASGEKKNSQPNYRFNITSGGIAAVTCLSLAVVAYMGIVLWRNVIHGNYDNREILLNEDDIGDINDEDLRHFEAVCIEIQA